MSQQQGAAKMQHLEPDGLEIRRHAYYFMHLGTPQQAASRLQAADNHTAGTVNTGRIADIQPHVRFLINNAKVKTWLAKRPRWHLHFIPIDSA